MRKVLHVLITGLCLSVFLQQAIAENSTHIPGFTIHHNALTTDFLTPEVAKTYDIRRSIGRGMLNISVIKDVPGTTGISVTAKVKVQSTNLLGQTVEIPLRKIQEDDAIYYIGDFPVANRANLKFDLQVIPEGQTKTFRTTFRQEFFTQ